MRSQRPPKRVDVPVSDAVHSVQGGMTMGGTARLELRIDPADKHLIEEAAATQRMSVSRFVVETAVRQAREVVGERASRVPRPIGGWSFALPKGWDEPLEDFEDWR